MLAKYNKCYVPAYGDDFFNDSVSRRYYGSGFASTPAVNIVEENDEFRIDVAAAGLSKNDFKIDLDADILTISAEKKQEKDEKKDAYTRREFNFASFSRSFKLNDKIDQEKLKAEHKDGILTIHLPKKEEAVKSGPKSISRQLIDHRHHRSRIRTRTPGYTQTHLVHRGSFNNAFGNHLICKPQVA